MADEDDLAETVEIPVKEVKTFQEGKISETSYTGRRTGAVH